MQVSVSDFILISDFCFYRVQARQRFRHRICCYIRLKISKSPKQAVMFVRGSLTANVRVKIEPNVSTFAIIVAIVVIHHVEEVIVHHS